MGSYSREFPFLDPSGGLGGPLKQLTEFHGLNLDLGFPKLGVPVLGVPIIRTLVVWGLYWGPLVLGSCHLSSASYTIKASRTIAQSSAFRVEMIDVTLGST